MIRGNRRLSHGAMFSFGLKLTGSSGGIGTLCTTGFGSPFVPWAEGVGVVFRTVVVSTAPFCVKDNTLCGVFDDDGGGVLGFPLVPGTWREGASIGNAPAACLRSSSSLLLFISSASIIATILSFSVWMSTVRAWGVSNG